MWCFVVVARWLFRPCICDEAKKHMYGNISLFLREIHWPRTLPLYWCLLCITFPDAQCVYQCFVCSFGIDVCVNVIVWCIGVVDFYAMQWLMPLNRYGVGFGFGFGVVLVSLLLFHFETFQMAAPSRWFSNELMHFEYSVEVFFR